MDPAFTASSKRPAQVHLFTAEDWEAHLLGGPLGAFAKASAFDGSAGKSVIAPREDGSIGDVLFGLGDGNDGLTVAGLSATLPAGDYEIARLPEGYAYEWAAAGWLDGAYRFDKYRKSETPVPRLVLTDGEDVAGIALEADAVRLVRDLVNTPAEDMGPVAIQGAISALAEDTGARLETTIGEALLDQNYPMIHAVGRAAAIAPRLMELSWGDPSHPELAIVGKGVAFDTGGLNIKTGDYMRLMKKDMGGAAHAIALAGLVMGANLPVRLHLLVPAVENAISGSAFRPGDVLSSRKGTSVEIHNTDAEGRLILGDALTRASEEKPELIIDFATLTGAARVALGPDFAAMMARRDDTAEELARLGREVEDEVWRLPLPEAYREYLASDIADMTNAPSNPYAGAIVAGLFLDTFVDEDIDWVHYDTFAWRPFAKPGRAKGGTAYGLRATWQLLKERYGAKA